MRKEGVTFNFIVSCNFLYNFFCYRSINLKLACIVKVISPRVCKQEVVSFSKPQNYL